MCLGNKVVDPGLMINDVGFEIVEIDDLGSLCLWEDEVEEEAESEP